MSLVVDSVEHRWTHPDPGTPGSAQEAEWKKAYLREIDVAGIHLWVHVELVAIFTYLCLALEHAGAKLAKVADDWGFANRLIAGSTSSSFHRTGQAVDLNAASNPQGPRRTTFPIRLTNRLCRKLALRWGYHYTTTPDAMHLEFIHLKRVARRITRMLNRPAHHKRAAAVVRKAHRKLRGKTNPHRAPTALVRPGARGDAVSWVQWQLGARVDGIYGPNTYRAVRHFQRIHALEVDGIVGKHTRRLLAHTERSAA